ncbi:YchJ family protein [Nocardioides sp. B-3]|uniref:YchJ family protein n=1 Tax=Nocardioides sp. B-3 TaxID=2895565 RepID=UPI0021536E8C|nr:YchJ family metal-binding protein [Nocardioides sp. B-3]UUZ60382.1 hypothetical protein LP418_05605 [Nocardioides sp. B-3]
MFTRDCPCGSASPYDACCGPLHRGASAATSPEQLMRSRFSAYAVGETDYVFRTRHPRTRPDDPAPEPGLTRTRLRGAPARPASRSSSSRTTTRPPEPGGCTSAVCSEQRGGRWVYVGQASGEQSVRQ